jgi:hypothetical protein
MNWRWRRATGTWVLLIVCIAAAVIAFLIGYLTSSPAQERPPYIVSKFEPRLLELERKAIDEAFEKKITSLWTVWMSDDNGQPARAIRGAAQARKAYIASMQELDRRLENLKREPIK